MSVQNQRKSGVKQKREPFDQRAMDIALKRWSEAKGIQGPTIKRGGRLKPVSDKKAAWNRKYHAEKARRLEKQRDEFGFNFCEYCGVTFKPEELDGHHPNGQAGKNIMIFDLINRNCHDDTHRHGKESRKLGRLK